MLQYRYVIIKAQNTLLSQLSDTKNNFLLLFARCDLYSIPLFSQILLPM